MKLIELVKNIEKKKILVIGDVMLDNYYFGKSTRISPEAPVPILLEKDNRKVLGGAANVAVNLVTGGQDVTMMSVVGNDKNGDDVISIFNKNNICSDFVFKDESRCTIVKNRFIGQNNMQMFRFDQEINTAVSDDIINKMYKCLEKYVSDFDIVVISDYNKGLLNSINTPKFIEIANKNNVKVLIDIKEPCYEKYKNAYLLKPNLDELHLITGLSVSNDEEILNACLELKRNTNCNYVLVTRGKDGMSLLKDDKLINIDCFSREVYDVTGAGDTVISYLTICLVNDYDLIDSANISSYAAGVKVSKMGTYAVKPLDIIDYFIDTNNIFDEDKVVTIDKLEKILKNNTKKIVFTNGCFDIFHVGHLRYLKESAKYGDMLIVGVNSDKSVKRLKGNNRPIVSEDERVELLSALSFISYIVLFDDDTPYEIIKRIKPDIITKGGDYNPDDVVGKDIVEAKGGKVVICPLVDNKSTTNIIDKILEIYHE